MRERDFAPASSWSGWTCKVYGLSVFRKFPDVRNEGSTSSQKCVQLKESCEKWYITSRSAIRELSSGMLHCGDTFRYNAC